MNDEDGDNMKRLVSDYKTGINRRRYRDEQ